jgi:hypothetical protein
MRCCNICNGAIPRRWTESLTNEPLLNYPYLKLDCSELHISTSMNPPGDCQVFAKEHDQEMYEPDY